MSREDGPVLVNGSSQFNIAASSLRAVGMFSRKRSRRRWDERLRSSVRSWEGQTKLSPAWQRPDASLTQHRDELLSALVNAEMQSNTSAPAGPRIPAQQHRRSVAPRPYSALAQLQRTHGASSPCPQTFAFGSTPIAWHHAQHRGKLDHATQAGRGPRHVESRIVAKAEEVRSEAASIERGGQRPQQHCLGLPLKMAVLPTPTQIVSNKRSRLAVLEDQSAPDEDLPAAWGDILVQVAPGLSRLSQNATLKQTNLHQRMTYDQSRPPTLEEAPCDRFDIHTPNAAQNYLQAPQSLVEPKVVVEQGAVAAASTRIGDCVQQEQESREAFMWRLRSVQPSENELLSPNEKGHAMRLRMAGDI